MPPVIVDTSQWVQYFRAGESLEAGVVEDLLTAGEAVMVGVVYAELLRGARNENQFRTLEEDLNSLPFLEVTRQTWNRTGSLLGDLQRRGLSILLPDALIAALALEHGYPVYTRDTDFQRVPGLELYEPQSSQS